MNGLPSMCGCHQCGGSEARNRAILARRVVAYAPFIPAARHTTAATLRNRIERPTLYSRLVMAQKAK